MKFDIYGRYQLDIVRSKDSWIILRVEEGKRRPETDMIIPASVTENDLMEYLEDLLHELARPGQRIRRI
jgi:hypothetical protein